MTKTVLLLVGTAVAGLAVACSSSTKPAVCSSLDDLKSSVGNITDVQPGENGLADLQANLATVKTDLNRVLQDAKAQYSAQVAQIRTDLTALQSAADTARSTHSATDAGQAVSAAKTLGASVRNLADAAKSTC